MIKLFSGYLLGILTTSIFGVKISMSIYAIFILFYAYPILHRVLFPSVDAEKIEILNEQFDDL